jgi:hypothetical protein
MLSIDDTFPSLDERSAGNFTVAPPSDVIIPDRAAQRGDQQASSMLKDNIMNYPEGSPGVPKGAGRSTNASSITPRQRTQLYNSAVKYSNENLNNGN